MKRTTAILRARRLRCVMVTNRLTAQGWKVTDVHTEGHSYDLYAERGSEQRCVEAKGLAGNASSAGVRLTGGELAIASQLGDEYWLYVVEKCFDGEGHSTQHGRTLPRRSVTASSDVSVVRLRGSELKAALDKQGDMA